MQTAEGKNNYTANNAALIALAQSENETEAMNATEKLIEANLGLVRSIAVRFRERGVDMEDLIQIGIIGMIKAIRSFDLERGTGFSTYAVPLIFGEIRRHLRDEGPIKVGRYYKKIGAMLMNAKNQIVANEGREPRIAELSQICGISPEEAAVAMDAISPVISLSEGIYGEENDTGLEDILPDEEATGDIERISDKIALGQAISRMPDLWRKIVLLRFYRDQTQQQTAANLGITQVKVSREEKKIIEFLRGELIK